MPMKFYLMTMKVTKEKQQTSYKISKDLKKFQTMTLKNQDKIILLQMQ